MNHLNIVYKTIEEADKIVRSYPDEIFKLMHKEVRTLDQKQECYLHILENIHKYNCSNSLSTFLFYCIKFCVMTSNNKIRDDLYNMKKYHKKKCGISVYEDYSGLLMDDIQILRSYLNDDKEKIVFDQFMVNRLDKNSISRNYGISTTEIYSISQDIRRKLVSKEYTW